MRKSWDKYFMDMAHTVSSRATCTRKQVGAVVVRARNVLATGYNGSLPGQPHCDEVPEDIHVVNGHCDLAMHAEANAICQAAKNGTSLLGAHIYVTASPCWPCFRLIVSSGITKIVFGEMYRDTRITRLAQDSGIELMDLSNG